MRRPLVPLLTLLLPLMLLGCGDDEAGEQGLLPTHEFEVGAVADGGGGVRDRSTGPARVPAAGEPLPTWTPSRGSRGGAPVAPSSVATAPPAVPPTAAPPSAPVAVPSGAPADYTPPADIPQPTVRPPQPVAAAGPPATDPEIEALMRQVSASRLKSDVKRLVGFGTRHALSETEDRRRGVGAARDWLAEAFVPTTVGAGSQLMVQREPFAFTYGGEVSDQENIVATLTGIGQRKRLVYVSAHYDSRVGDLANATADAPGADDNASGVAGLLELARVMGGRQWDASIRLVAFAAEEQGMHGSRHHAPQARQVGLPIEAVLNLDVIGGGADALGATVTDRLRVFSADPDEGPSRALARHVAMIAQRYGPLSAEIVPQSDREGRQSDHQPFSEAGFAAARLISATEDLTRQHHPADTPERMDSNYHADVVRLTVALASNLALAPAAPSSAPGLAVAAERPGTLRVTPPAPNAAGYWVAWRVAGEPTYRAWLWSAGAELTLDGLPSGATVAVTLAAADDAGHTSLFGPEASATVP